MYNTLEEARYYLNLHQEAQHGGKSDSISCLTCRNLEARVKYFYKDSYPGSVPDSVLLDDEAKNEESQTPTHPVSAPGLDIKEP